MVTIIMMMIKTITILIMTIRVNSKIISVTALNRGTSIYLKNLLGMFDF